LAYGGDWFIEVWEGTGMPDHDGPDFPVELGKRLAGLHAMPTSWFDPWREKLRVERPALLANASEGSHVWFCANRLNGWFTDHSPEAQEVMAAWSAACGAFDPLSAASKRIVMTHGDLHRENLLQTDSGIKFADLEFTGVSFAVWDLSYVITCCTWDPGHAMWADDNAKHRVFLEAYLKASEQPCAVEDVEVVLHDCWLARNFNPIDGRWPVCCMDIKNLCESLNVALKKISLLPFAERTKMVDMEAISNCEPLRELSEQVENHKFDMLSASMQK